MLEFVRMPLFTFEPLRLEFVTFVPSSVELAMFEPVAEPFVTLLLVRFEPQS